LSPASWLGEAPDSAASNRLSHWSNRGSRQTSTWIQSVPPRSLAAGVEVDVSVEESVDPELWLFWLLVLDLVVPVWLLDPPLLLVRLEVPPLVPVWLLPLVPVWLLESPPVLFWLLFSPFALFWLLEPPLPLWLLDPLVPFWLLVPPLVPLAAPDDSSSESLLDAAVGPFGVTFRTSSAMRCNRTRAS
jgi:hypothetical protein